MYTCTFYLCCVKVINVYFDNNIHRYTIHETLFHEQTNDSAMIKFVIHVHSNIVTIVHLVKIFTTCSIIPVLFIDMYMYMHVHI